MPSERDPSPGPPRPLWERGLGGEGGFGDWLLTPERVAVHLPTRTVVVADLHLGYDRVRRRGGEALPARSIARELAPLRDLLSREEIRRVVVAGDLFEDGRYQREEMVEELHAWLTETGAELVGVVPGNHDRGLVGAALPVCPDGIELEEWRIVHGDKLVGAEAVVQGHEHPYLRLPGGAEGPCYLVARRHLVLPAYSA